MASNSIETFEVKLDEMNRVFFPGDAVSGSVNLKLKEDLKIKEMRLECRGEAYVNWPEYSGSYTRYHYNKERYFSTMAVIFGEGESLKLACRIFSTNIAADVLLTALKLLFSVKNSVHPEIWCNSNLNCFQCYANR